MVDPISSSGPSLPTSGQQSPKEKQEQFEEQFYTALLSDYISVSHKNGSLKQELSKLKDGIASSKPHSQIASDINHLVDQINNGISPGKAKFPPFQSTTEGNETSTLMNYVIALEKVATTAGEHGAINWSDEMGLFQKLSGLFDKIGGMTTNQAFEKINEVVSEMNKDLPSGDKIPSLPDELRR